MDITIRKLEPSEYPRLEDFTYEAIFQRDPEHLIPRDVLQDPAIKVFYEDFGRPDDRCFVAEQGGKLLGAVWTRILAGEVRGFGNIDPYTPEFAISVYPSHRGQGIGTALMRRMLEELRACGYRRTSLAVQRDNYAVKMYQNVGFAVIGATEEEYLMLYVLDGIDD